MLEDLKEKNDLEEGCELPSAKEQDTIQITKAIVGESILDETFDEEVDAEDNDKGVIG